MAGCSRVSRTFDATLRPFFAEGDAMLQSQAFTATAALTFLTACNAAYAPPIRSGEDGAPGRLHQGDLEATGTVTYPGTGGPDVGYAVSDIVGVEAGAEISPAWAMGYAGSRFTYQARAKDDEGNLGKGFALDGGGGVGAGKGGSNGLKTYAGGGYLLGGVAYYFPYIAFYARTRVEQSFAEGLPATLWWSTTAGMQLWAGPFALFAETGGFGYSNDTLAQNENTRLQGWLPVQGGIALHVDVAPKSKSAPTKPTVIGMR